MRDDVFETAWLYMNACKTIWCFVIQYDMISFLIWYNKYIYICILFVTIQFETIWYITIWYDLIRDVIRWNIVLYENYPTLYDIWYMSWYIMCLYFKKRSNCFNRCKLTCRQMFPVHDAHDVYNIWIYRYRPKIHNPSSKLTSPLVRVFTFHIWCSWAPSFALSLH